MTIAITTMIAKMMPAATRRRNRAECHLLVGAAGAAVAFVAGADVVAMATSPPRPWA